MVRRVLRSVVGGGLPVYAGAALVAALVAAPILWLVISSVAEPRELLAIPLSWIPKEPTLERYRAILGLGQESEFLLSLRNSFVVGVVVSLASLGLGVFAAYALGRLKMPGRDVLSFALLFSYMIHPISIILPMYRVASRMGLLDSRTLLVITYTGLLTPLVIWLLRSYFQSIPADLEDAARMDGCSRVGALMRVILPLSVPGIVATGLFAFLASWEEFFIALITTTSPAAKTVPVAIAEFSGRHSVDFGMMATGGVVASAVPMLLALVFQRYIVSGLTAGALKG